MQNKSYCNSWLPIAKPISGKVAILELSTKMSLTNLIERIFKGFFNSFRKEMRNQVKTIAYVKGGQASPKYQRRAEG